MKARIDFVCKPAKKNAQYESENIYMIVDLPFVPTAGMMLKLTRDGDYIKVADVLLNISPGSEELRVNLEEPDEDWQLRPWPEMRAQGWQIG